MENNESKNETAVQENAVAEKKPAAKKKNGGASNIIRIIVLILCVGVFAFSVVKIGSDLMDDSSTGDEVDDLKDLVGRDDEHNLGEITEDPAVYPDDPETQGPNTTVEPDNSGETDNTETPDNTENTENNENTAPPNNSGSSESTENSGTTENSGSTAEQTPPTQPEDETKDPVTTPEQTVPNQNPNASYDDQTAEEAEKDKTQNTIVTVTRPGSSLDKTDLSVIHPDNIKLQDIAYLSGIDFSKLEARNKDTVAWICIPGNDSITGLPVDTAVVQTTDNYYYLSHSFDKSENVNGWIYADYRNDMENITANYNTVIYGHARSYRMFGGLKNLNENPDWYKNGYNHFIKITTPKDETIWQIFSWHETNVYYDYIKTEFDNGQDFIDFATELQNKNELKGYFSTFDFTENNRIITLSTCKGSNPANRVAVHAVLVARNPLG